MNKGHSLQAADTTSNSGGSRLSAIVPRTPSLRGVSKSMEAKVVAWLEYYWGQRSVDSDEQVHWRGVGGRVSEIVANSKSLKAFDTLPVRLQRDLASHLHLKTLRNVPLFEVEVGSGGALFVQRRLSRVQECERGLL